MPITKQEQKKTEHTSVVRIQHSACSVVYDQIATSILPYVLGLKLIFSAKLKSKMDRHYMEPIELTKTPADSFNTIQNHEKSYRPFPHPGR